MTLIEKIDAVFLWLYDHSGENPTLTALTKEFKDRIDIGEIRDILIKLNKDGLMRCVYENNDDVNYHDGCNFLINFNGKYFKETTGSFTNKIKEENDLKEVIHTQNSYPAILNTWTRRLTYATILAAVLIVGWDILKTFWVENCH